jgi:KUP system potassium uptake protein
VLLDDPAAVANPFYMSVPDWAQVPMLVLATTAAAVASQAVITGAFSVTRQAIQLGYLPRLQIKHTSQRHHRPDLRAVDQLDAVRRGHGAGAGFRSSTNLATAYGLSVTGTMLIDTLLLAIVAYTRWPDSRRWVLPLCACSW